MNGHSQPNYADFIFKILVAQVGNCNSTRIQHGKDPAQRHSPKHRIFSHKKQVFPVRLGSNTSDEFMKNLGEKSQKISQIFQKNIEQITTPASVKVMLGDTTITEQTTFDPEGVKMLYGKIIDSLPDWKTSGIAMTSDEDLRRIFLKLEKQAGNYVLLWHMSLQYHALLYYKVDINVQKIQKELAELLDNTVDKERELAELTDSMIKEKLESLGFKDVDEQKLFEDLTHHFLYYHWYDYVDDHHYLMCWINSDTF